MDFLLKFLSRILQWIIDFCEWFLLWLCKVILQAAAVVLAWIPVPDWLSGAGGNLSDWVGSFPLLPNVIATTHIGFGLTVMIGAMTIRFLIRRIPLIG